MKIDVLMHDDWELNGDGSGSIDELMFDPAQKILEVCERHGAKYTFFAEVGQQFAMLASPRPEHRRAAERWEKTLVDAVRRGHDVQLHLHPQWIGAAARAEGGFDLHFDKWSIGRLAYNEIFPVLKKGKEYLERLLTSAVPDYRVVAFRAGSYMIQPSGTIYRALKDIGVLADVTVMRGLRMASETLGSVDFSKTPSTVKPWFPSTDDFTVAAPTYGGLFCIPTFSTVTRMPLPVFAFFANPFSLDYYRRKRIFDRRRAYKPVYYSGQKKPTGPRALALDFGQMHSSTLLKLVKKFRDDSRRDQWAEGPLILYTHSKQFFSVENLDRFLVALSGQADIRFSRTRDAVLGLHERFQRQNA
jgi:hypothetical protein